MELLGDEGHVKSRFGPFRGGVIVVQDRCTACAKRTVGLDTILDALMVLLGDEAQVQAHFGLFRDSASLDIS